MTKRSRVGLTVLPLIVACASQASPGNDERVGSVQQGVLTPSLSAYPNGATVQIAFDGMQGAARDWIAIATPGSPADKFVAWKYTGPATAGQVSFTGLPAGTYVARAFYDWPTGAYTIAQTSAEFTIAGAVGAPSVTPPATVAWNTPFTVSFANLPGYTTDWIGVAPAGSPTSTVTQWGGYTKGAISGTASFTGLPPGSYVARAFRCWECTTTYDVIASTPFTVSSNAATTTLSLQPAFPVANAALTVAYTNMSRAATDWISVAVAGSPDTSLVRYAYTNGNINGSVSLAGLPAGNYEARAYYDWAGTQSYTVRARTAFSVASQQVFLDTFSSLTGGQTGTQCTTGRTVHAFANLSGWTKSGTNVVHGVQATPGNFAVSFFDTNSIVMTTGAAANEAGVTYRVGFRGGPSAWNSCAQTTSSAGGVVIDVLRGNNTVLSTFTYLPGAWAGAQTLAPASFTYTGDGSGVVRLRLTDNLGDGRFGGAIDDLGIYVP